MSVKYRVVLPNPNGESKRVYCLVKAAWGVAIARIGRTKYYFERDLYELTESEIKQDFEWAWQFAEEVTDDTEV